MKQKPINEVFTNKKKYSLIYIKYMYNTTSRSCQVADANPTANYHNNSIDVKFI